jgi:hypothetical protein
MWSMGWSRPLAVVAVNAKAGAQVQVDAVLAVVEPTSSPA